MKTKNVSDRRLKNLLAKMITDGAMFPSEIYEECDIPTRETIDEYLPKIKKVFGKMFVDAQK